MSKPVYSKETLDAFAEMCEARRKQGPIKIVILDSIPPIKKPEDELSKEYKFEEIVNMGIKDLSNEVNKILTKQDIALLVKIGEKVIKNNEEKKHECKCGGNCENSSKDKKFKLNLTKGESVGSLSEKVKEGELKADAPIEPSEKDTPNKSSHRLADAIIRDVFNRLDRDKQHELSRIMNDAMDYLENCDAQDIDKYRAASVLGMVRLDEYVKYYIHDTEYARLTTEIKDRVKYLERFEYYSKRVNDLYNIAINLPSWQHITPGDTINRVKDLKVALLHSGIIIDGEYALELIDLAFRFQNSYVNVKCEPDFKWGIREDDIKNITNNLFI